MAKRLRRREFLGMTVASVALPTIWGATESEARALLPAGTSPAQPGKMWDYQARPVKATNPDLKETYNNGAHCAFDGYGGSMHPNSVAHGWVQPGTPSAQKPFFCTIDYGEPVAISKFVHYFYVPAVKDYRTDPLLTSSAFSALNIHRSEDGSNWSLAESLTELSADWPQVITLSRPAPARYYKLEVTGLIAGAQEMRTYEIESFTGPVIHAAHPGPNELRVGDDGTLQGGVVGVENPGSFTITAVSSKDSMASLSPVPVDTTGDFRVSLAALRSGNVPAVLELKDGQGDVVDRRSLTLRVAPRVVVSDVRVDGATVTGRLQNAGATGASVKVACGKKSVSMGQLAPGKATEFRLSEETQGAGRHVVELRLEENGQVASHWAFPVERVAIAQTGRFHNQQVEVTWSAEGGTLRLDSAPGKDRKAMGATVEATFDGTPVSFSASEADSGKVVLWGSHDKGWLRCALELAGSSTRATFRSVSEGWQEEAKSSGVLAVRLRPENVTFRFMPAYVYSKEPVSYFEGVYGKQPLVLGGWFPPTRMVALETTEGTLALVPDRDRCLMGVDQNDAVVKLHLGSEPAEILIPAVAGDWFESFRYVVNNVYKFTEPRQYQPLIESVIGQAKYLSSNEDIWSRKMQVVTSFPKQDYVFAFYGLTYTIPALYAWYQMTGDPEALERTQKCVRWLLDYPGVRIKEGPAVGAFFSQYTSPEIDELQMGSGTAIPVKCVGGCDQGDNQWLEPHASGAVAWALLHYYVADVKRDGAALEAAKAALDWLLQIQNPSGGWFYAYKPDGTKLTNEEDAGNIWNIWALYRYGKLTGDGKYLDAAEKGKKWFASEFLAKHICRGYWEDVSGDAGHVRLSWEAYEFGIAADAFADMGDKELAVEAARNAVTWIWTRVADCREYFNSYGHAHEQWNWPPGAYIAPMLGLAAQTAYRLTGDEFFRKFAGAAKTTGWWTVRETPEGIFPKQSTRAELGAAFWPVEGMEFVPLEEPLGATFWADWDSSHKCTICLRWLIQEVNLRSAGKIAVDPETLAGAILGSPGKLALRPDELTIKAQHEQINWLGYRTEGTRVLAILNHDAATTARVDFPSLLSVPSKVLTTSDGKQWREEAKGPENPLKIVLPARGTVLLVWPEKSARLAFGQKGIHWGCWWGLPQQKMADSTPAQTRSFV